MVTLIQIISYCSFEKCSYKYYFKYSNFKLENVACKPMMQNATWTNLFKGS